MPSSIEIIFSNESASSLKTSFIVMRVCRSLQYTRYRVRGSPCVVLKCSGPSFESKVHVNKCFSDRFVSIKTLDMFGVIKVCPHFSRILARILRHCRSERFTSRTSLTTSTSVNLFLNFVPNLSNRFGFILLLVCSEFLDALQKVITYIFYSPSSLPWSTKV